MSLQIRAYIFFVLAALASSSFGQTTNDSVTAVQESGPSVIGFGIGFGFGNQISIGSSLDILGELNNPQGTLVGVRISYRGSIFRPANKPDDYRGFDLGNVESSTMISAMFAVEAPSRQRKIRCGLALGPAYNYIYEIIYTPDDNYSDPFDSNYHKTLAGIHFNFIFGRI
jgi:hypothetical protein